jgi:hypothetical protein
LSCFSAAAQSAGTTIEKPNIVDRYYITSLPEDCPAAEAEWFTTPFSALWKQKKSRKHRAGIIHPVLCFLSAADFIMII